MIHEISDIPIMCIESDNGPKGASQAFKKLEAPLSSLKGRSFYGKYNPKKNIYHACVVINNTDNPHILGLETGVIQGGKYAHQKIEKWAGKEHLIVIGFHNMKKTNKYDDNRPNIEYYKSQKELILMLPVKD